MPHVNARRLRLGLLWEHAGRGGLRRLPPNATARDDEIGHPARSPDPLGLALLGQHSVGDGPEVFVRPRAGKEVLPHKEGGDSLDAETDRFLKVPGDALLVLARVQEPAELLVVEIRASGSLFEDVQASEVLPVLPVGPVERLVEHEEPAMLLGVLGCFERELRVGDDGGPLHYEAGLARIGLQGLCKLIRRFTGAKLSGRPFSGSVGSQQERLPVQFDIVVFSQAFDPFQADIAPRSYVVIPEGDANGFRFGLLVSGLHDILEVFGRFRAGDFEQFCSVYMFSTRPASRPMAHVQPAQDIPMELHPLSVANQSGQPWMLHLTLTCYSGATTFSTREET